ncbi:hypothetical protein pb186bvf_003671 [Paramecium bursaria]
MDDLYEVEDIVDRRYDSTKKQYLYLIKWKGYPSDQNTWEPKGHLSGCQPYLNEFNITQEPLYRETMKKLLKDELIKFIEQNKPKRQEFIQNEQEQVQFDIPIELQTHNSHKLGRGFTWAQEEQAPDLNIDY